ncbi:MAG: DUF998 domain-containing protein [Candidatus Heimdallarchaeota archaeon]|nr:DUF998 domain-containing protein [Candidatus Heimdallarchaeota archaeon]MBY8993820.1 DUF998 domain-containing protein [Candidatus Heimdallarchaeota archaeon]
MIGFKILAICGMLSPIIYTLMWVIGGFIVPEYNHLHKDISSLFAVKAHRRWLFQSLIIASSALMLVFFAGSHWGTNNGEGSIVGPILFIISAVMGLLVACLFPLDEGGKPTAWRGKGHVVLVVSMGILQIVAMFFLFFSLRLVDGWKGFGIFNLVSAIVSLILVGVMSFFGGKPYMGLAERFMASAYQIFYFVFALVVYFNN